MARDENQGVHFAKGTKIFDDGDPGGTAFIVETGKVEISKQIEGEKVVLGVVGANEIFGELATLDDSPRMATAIAVEDTDCIVVTEQDIKNRLESTDAFTQALIRILVRSIRSTAAVFEEWQQRA